MYIFMCIFQNATYKIKKVTWRCFAGCYALRIIFIFVFAIQKATLAYEVISVDFGMNL